MLSLENSHLPRDSSANKQNVDIEVGTDLVVAELSEPQVLKGVGTVGVVDAVVTENVSHVVGNLAKQTAKSILGIIGKRNGDDL